MEINNKIIKAISKSIKGTEYENKVFVVGGFVRDLIMGKDPKDIDLLIDGDINAGAGITFAEWFCKKENIFKKDSNPLVYGLYGTAMFQFMGEKIECVAPRSEKYQNDSRKPVVSSCTLEDDCFRRDFTVNSLFINISNNELVDYSKNGLNDIKNKVIRSTSNPDIIFTEDPLRILRAIRFATRFNSTIEEKTFEGMKRHVDRLEIISKERIQDEFSKMITSDNPEFAIRLLFEIGAYKYVFDKLMFESDLKYLAKSIPASFERLKMQKDAEHNNLEINLAIVYAQLPNVVNKMKYLKFSNDVIKKVCFYLELFDMILFTNFTPASIRKVQYLAKSYDNLFNACTIFVSVMNRKGDIERVEKILNMTKKMIEKGQAMFDYKLPVNGNDVMEILNINPSKNVKRYLNLLMDMAYANPFITKKECETILKCN